METNCRLVLLIRRQRTTTATTTTTTGEVRFIYLFNCSKERESEREYEETNCQLVLPIQRRIIWMIIIIRRRRTTAATTTTTGEVRFIHLFNRSKERESERECEETNCRLVLPIQRRIIWMIIIIRRRRTTAATTTTGEVRFIHLFNRLREWKETKCGLVLAIQRWRQRWM